MGRKYKFGDFASAVNGLVFKRTCGSEESPERHDLFELLAEGVYNGDELLSWYGIAELLLSRARATSVRCGMRALIWYSSRAKVRTCRGFSKATQHESLQRYDLVPTTGL